MTQSESRWNFICLFKFTWLLLVQLER